jgi:amino acid transporter
MSSIPEGDAGAREGEGLRRECLSFPEVLGQSVANVAPTATPTMNIPLVFAQARSGTWLSYLIATIGMVLVGANINQFARRSASPGSLYEYVERGLGPTIGVLTGWALAGAYLLTASATLCGFAEYAQQVLHFVGLAAHPVLLFVVCAAVAGALAYRDVRLSATLMLVLEFVSIATILALAGVVILRNGAVVDHSQLHLGGASLPGIGQGLVLAVFSFVGFESATALGAEARDPLRSIPKSVIWSTVAAGLFFVVIAYIEVLGFSGREVSLADADAPLDTLARLSGVPFFGIVISVSAAISFFACCLACINAGARFAFSLARHGVLHPLIGHAHPELKTPGVSVVMVTLCALAVSASMGLFNLRVLDIYGYLGTIATFGFLLVYVLISVSAPVYLRRVGALRPRDVALSAVSVLFMLGVSAASVYGVTQPPMSVLPYLFLMGLGIGVGWFLMLRLHSPKTLHGMTEAIDAQSHAAPAGE